MTQSIKVVTWSKFRIWYK